MTLRYFWPLFAFGLALATGCTQEEAAHHETSHRGQSAPRFEMLRAGDAMPLFEGVGLDSTDVRLGPGSGLTLVNLWATWCAPCIAEFPELQALHEEFSDDGLRVLGINVDETDVGHIQAFVDELGATFLIALDPGADYQDTVRAVVMPMSYLVDNEGTLIKSWTGRITEKEAEEIRELVNAALS